MEKEKKQKVNFPQAMGKLEKAFDALTGQAGAGRRVTHAQGIIGPVDQVSALADAIENLSTAGTSSPRVPASGWAHAFDRQEPAKAKTSTLTEQYESLVSQGKAKEAEAFLKKHWSALVNADLQQQKARTREDIINGR